MPADAPSLIPPALDQLHEHPAVVSEEAPSLLERSAEVPDPRDPRGVHHRLAIVLALTACAVPTGAASLPAVGGRRSAVGEWNADAPAHVLEQVGARPDPLPPRRVLPAETTGCPLHRDPQGQPEGAAQAAQVPSVEGHPASGPHQGCRRRSEIRRIKVASVNSLFLPGAPPGRPDQKQPQRPQDRQSHEHDPLRSRRPDRRAVHPGPASPTRPRPLADRCPAPRPRHHLRRGRLTAAGRQRAPRDGHLSRPRHRSPPDSRS
ncbi:transposase family protein [Streptomyces sp. Qhu-G9]|nr:transposase family protein [Streptomyces aurantiacus]WAU82040.1 transposase family protein [Streptomyces aurantiacus]